MITEMMTVNHILRMWPEARPVFGIFGIDREVDGSCFLDELCWWRGLDVQVLVAALRRVEHRQVSDHTMPQPVGIIGGGVFVRQSGRGNVHAAGVEAPAQDAGR